MTPRALRVFYLCLSVNHSFSWNSFFWDMLYYPTNIEFRIGKWIFSNKLPSWSTHLSYSFSKHDLVWKQLQVQDFIHAIKMLNCAEHQSELISWGNRKFMNDVCFLLWEVKSHWLKNICIKYLKLYRQIWDPITHHYSIVKKKVLWSKTLGS